MDQITSKYSYKSRTLQMVSLALIEDLDVLTPGSSVVILPPENACDVITDEDSGEEDNVVISNLPGAQLRTEAQIILSEADTDFDSDDGNVPLDFDSDDDNVPLSSFVTKAKTTSKRPKLFSWTKTDLTREEYEWKDVQGPKQNLTPSEIFLNFFDDEVVNMIVRETNRYASQKNLNGDVTNNEIKCFIGVLLLSGYNTVPRRKMYWQNEKDANNELVYNAMSRDRFTFIMNNIHFNDNNDLDPNDKYAKMRPLFDILNKKFKESAPIEECHSVDEAMVPYFGRHGCKQFIRGKPIRWGYKFWVGTTRLGYIIWFEPYQGSGSGVRNKDLGLGASVVLTYVDVLLSLGHDIPFHIFFDNFFTSLPLLQEIKAKGLKATGTVRENRTSKCPLITSKQMKKEPRGSIDYMLADGEIIICKWNDNSVVTIASNSTPVFPIRLVSRYSQKEKKRIAIDQPNLVKEYNENMGGVDRCDQNISLYRISIRGKKWYFPLISQCIDMAMQNSWQLHRSNGGKIDQLTFRRSIATGLLETFKKCGKRGPSKPPKSFHEHSRFDRLDHLVIYQEKQTRCGVCHKKVQSKCSKCDIALHIKDCFIMYHTK